MHAFEIFRQAADDYNTTAINMSIGPEGIQARFEDGHAVFISNPVADEDEIDAAVAEAFENPDHDHGEESEED